MKLPALLSFALLSAPQVSARPNLVIFYVDDLGYGDVSAYNPEAKITTPAIDRLATEGVRFTDGHSAAAICTPSRYGLMTGRYPWRGWWQGPLVANESTPLIIEEGRLTLPQMLKNTGYQTAAFGKWHLGFNETKGKITKGPLSAGFDTYAGFKSGIDKKWVSNDAIARDAQGRPVNYTTRDVNGRIVDASLDWLRTAAKTDAPFFLYIATTLPHSPFNPAPDYVGKSGLGDYGDFLLEMDALVAKVDATLRELGRSDDTIFIFSSDNGPDTVAKFNTEKAGDMRDDGIMAYERLTKWGHASMGALRGTKHTPFEGGHRVPFIVRWPGVTRPGTVSDRLVSQLDIMATMAGILGVRLPADAAEDSVDFSPLLRGEDRAVRDGGLFGSGTHQVLAVRKGTWVLFTDRDPDKRPYWHSREPASFRSARKIAAPYAPGQLFNLVDDPGQTRDVAADHPAVVDELRAYAEHVKNHGHRSP